MYLSNRRTFVMRGTFSGNKVVDVRTTASIATESSYRGTTCASGSVAYRSVYAMCALPLLPSALCKATYPNGDVRVYRETGQGRETLWFRTSGRCRDGRFANRLLYGVAWRDVSVGAGPVSASTSLGDLFEPIDDSPQRDLFRQYVAAGMIGWSDVLMRAYLKHFEGIWLPSDVPIVRTHQTTPDAVGVSDAMGALPPSRKRKRTHDGDGGSESPTCKSATSRANDCDGGDDESAPHERAELGVLSNGSVHRAQDVERWFEFLIAQGLPMCDPVTNEYVAPFVSKVPWRVLDVRHTVDDVARAYLRTWTLIADGADLLVTDVDMVVQSLARIAALDNRVRLEPLVRATDERWLRHQKRVIAGMRAGAVSLPAGFSADGSRFFTDGAEFVDVRDVDVPPASKTHVHETWVRSNLHRVTWRDRTFDVHMFAGATLVRCHFVQCRFVRCCFVDAHVVECTFERCRFYTNSSRNREGHRSCSLVADRPARILARMGCRRVHGIVEL